jgi:hypothetical protein
MPPSSNTVSVATDSSISFQEKVDAPSRPLSSLRDILMGLPVSRVMVTASDSRSRTTPARKASMQALRWAMVVAAQAGWAARAAAALAATDAASSAGRVVMSWPLAGLWMASVFMIVWRARQPESR